MVTARAGTRSVRQVVSVAIILHLVAVLTAVAMPPYFGGTSARVVAWLYAHVTRHYLEFFALTNDYRFYAPDVATYEQAWFRFVDANGNVWWQNFARRSDYALHMRYQRRLGIPLMLQSALRLSSSKAGAITITPAGQVLFASLARYAAREEQTRGRFPTEIQIYLVAHRARQPAEIELGRSATDPRLYLPRYLGTYDGEGRSTISSDPPPEYPAIPMSLFLATMLHEDLASGRAIDRDTLPDPVREILARHPEPFAQGSTEEVRERLRVLLAAADQPPTDPSSPW